MKLKYFKPEVEISYLTSEDILDSSPGKDVDNEVFIGADSLYG